MAQDKRVRFKFNDKKALEAILWIANRAPAKVDVYKIVKTMFFADKFHISTYGRPICGDHYVAMEFGPVPSHVYDMLTGKGVFSKGIKSVITREGDAINPSRQPNLEILSESDVEGLQAGWDKVRDLSFKQLVDLTHEDLAYKKAWARRGSKRSVDINFSDLIGDTELCEKLRKLAPYLVI